MTMHSLERNTMSVTHWFFFYKVVVYDTDHTRLFFLFVHVKIDPYKYREILVLWDVTNVNLINIFKNIKRHSCGATNNNMCFYKQCLRIISLLPNIMFII